MNQPAVKKQRRFRAYILALPALLLLIAVRMLAADNAGQPTNSPFSVRATHILGFEDASNNANGTLSLQDNILQFQKSGKPAVELKIVSVQDIFLGGESKQVGGTAMMLGKAAMPYGGGRVVSLFAHKKYDTIALQYIDNDGGVHGAIFQLAKGQAEVVRKELVARGAHVSDSQEESTKQSTAEVPRETN
jgi:hypothetical protein